MKRRLLHALEVPALVAVPAVLVACAFLRLNSAVFLTTFVALASIAVFFAGFEFDTPHVRTIMPAVVLGALAAAGRIIFAPIPDFKPVTAFCIIAGSVFGRRCGFMVGCLAALVSNFFFGQGIWTAWQMYAWGLIGYIAGLLSQAGAFSRFDSKGARKGVHVFLVCAFGFLSCLVYGFILNTWTLVGFVSPITLPAALAVYGAGLPFDLVHGVSTCVFLLLMYVPWEKRLVRIKAKYALS